MKIQPLAKVVLILACALISSRPVSGQLFWDPDGATSGGSVSGNWDSVTANWTATLDSGVNTTWTGVNDANFAVSNSFTVTLTEPLTVGNVTVTGSTGILTVAGTSLNTLTLGLTTSTFNIGAAKTNIVSAPLVGSGATLLKSGSGVLILSGSNTYDGGTILSAGTIGIGSDSASPGGVLTSGALGTGTFTFSAAATVFASGAARVVHNPVVLNGGLTDNGALNLTFTNGDFKINGGQRNISVSGAGDLIIGGNLIDDGVARVFLKIQRAGRLILAGTNTSYLGALNINSGTVRAGSATALPPNGVINVHTNSLLEVNGYDFTINRLGGNGGSGVVALGTNTLTVGNNVTSAEFTGVISGTGGFVKVGTISQVLSGTNTFTGGILIKEGPIYFPTNGVSGSAIALGAGPNVITITNSGQIGQNKIGLSILTNRVVLANVGPTAVLTPAGAGTVQFILAGQVSGTGGFLRTSTGSGVVSLAGDNTFSGGVQMDARVLGFGHRNALGTGTLGLGNPGFVPPNTIVIASTTNLTGANAITNVTIVSQSFTVADATSGATDLELSGPMTLSNAITVTSAGSALVKFSGGIDGPGSLTKAGTNGLTLTGANTYEGTTTVSDGALIVNNTSGSGTSTNTVAVAGGATLGGTGTVAGAVTVSSGGNIGGGSSVGKLTLLSGLDLSAGGNNNWELGAPRDNNTGTAGTDFDQIAISDGGLNLGSSATLTLGFIGATNAPSTTNVFWRTSHAWTIVKLSGLASNVTSTAFVTINNGTHSVGNFTNSVAGDGILLTYNATAAPSISSVARSGNDVNITFLAANGSNYRVEYATSLSPANWQLLQNVTGAGVPVTITDTNPADPQRFYRVVLTD